MSIPTRSSIPWLLALLAITPTVHANDEWPTHRHDLGRSGVTTAAIDAPRLEIAWTWHSPRPPQPAWPGPAKWDAFAGLKGLKSMRNYDPVFHLIAVTDDAGPAVFFGSSVDDTVRRLDGETGDVVWTRPTGGPVRVAPTWHDGVVYAGSDDGYAYAIDAGDGSIVWRFSPDPDADLVLNNGRLISTSPVRTGVHVFDGTAYFAASFLPWRSTRIAAVDAVTGRADGDTHGVRDIGTGWTMEGPLLLSATSLIAPQGRVAPIVIDRATREPRGPLSGGGGSFVLLTGDDHVLHGPGNKDGWITDSAADSRERIASYDRGHAMVVRDSVAYMLSERTLSAFDRENQDLLWSREVDSPYELILAGSTLFVGGYDVALAFDATDGTPLWRGDVEGRAYGLAVAHDRLIVSTDEGVIHAFAPTSEPMTLDTDQEGEAEPLPIVAIEPVRDDRLLDRWIFQTDAVGLASGAGDDHAVLANQVAGRPAARFLGLPRWIHAGERQAYEMDGRTNDLEATDDHTTAALPRRAMSALAWVRIDAGTEWGGLVGALQDNGGFERGWLLGYRGKRPGFALQGVDADDGYTWITGPVIEPGSWHLIAASYDGETMRLYLDGELVQTSNVESGDINYPPRTWYSIGSYHDDDEYFKLTGALHEIRVYNDVLQDDEMRSLAQRTLDRLPVDVVRSEPAEEGDPTVVTEGPILRFGTSRSAIVQWRGAAETRLTIRAGGETTSPTVRRYEGRDPLAHGAGISGLDRDRVYHYRIEIPETGRFSPWYEIDASFNFATDSLPEELPLTDRGGEETLSSLMRPAVAVAVDPDPALLHALADSPLHLIVLAGPDQPAPILRDLCEDLRAGAILSTAVRHDTLDDPRWPEGFVNILFLSKKPGPDDMAAIERVLAPGGIALLADPDDDTNLSVEIVTRGADAPDAGVWTHQYGLADNSAYGGEGLGGVTSNEQLRLQWIGRPGPRFQSDRQNRKPAPLAAGGRLYMQGLNRIIAADAYNGTILWSLEMPELQRFNMPRDCANWCATTDRLYAATGDHLTVIDGDRGIDDQIHVPRGPRDVPYEWGYIAAPDDDSIVGSLVQRDSMHEAWWGSEHWYDAKTGFAVEKVCSDAVFRMDAADATVRWISDRESLILNSTITIADGLITFLESRNVELRDGVRRRVEDDRLWSDLWMTALDLETGREVWSRDAQPMPGKIAVYTAASDGRLYLQTSDNGAFALYAFDLASGESLWRRKFSWETDHHGKHLSRIAVAEGRLYLRPYTLDAVSGEVLTDAFPAGHQCGIYACSANALFLRAGNLAMWDPSAETVSRWERVRPDCWISTIPACGMLLSPEGGGGCSCGSWMETSMGFRPVRSP